MPRECRERLSRHRLQRKPLVSEPNIHHGTCVTHVPWCMSGSLTRGGAENAPGIPGAFEARNFTYLARDPYYGKTCTGHKDIHLWNNFTHKWKPNWFNNTNITPSSKSDTKVSIYITNGLLLIVGFYICGVIITKCGFVIIAFEPSFNIWVSYFVWIWKGTFEIPHKTCDTYIKRNDFYTTLNFVRAPKFKNSKTCLNNYLKAHSNLLRPMREWLWHQGWSNSVDLYCSTLHKRRIPIA